MRRSFLTIILISLLAGSSFSQIKSERFSLIIGSCFKSDTIDISINGQKLIRDVIVSSDFSIGITQLAVYQDKNGLWITNENKKTNYRSIDVNKGLTIDLRVNGVLTSKSVDLRKGQILMLDNCYIESKKGKPEKTLTVKQYKRTIVLE